MLVSDFGIRLKEDEIRDLVVEYLGKMGYEVKSDAISIVPLTNGRIEFVIRPFLKK